MYLSELHISHNSLTLEFYLLISDKTRGHQISVHLCKIRQVGEAMKRVRNRKKRTKHYHLQRT